MVKVCHLTSVHSIEDIRIFHKECVSLAKNGFNVTLIASGETTYDEIKNGVRLISLKIPVKNRIQRMFKRTRAIYKKALELNADIYHLHDPELIPYGFILKKKGKKVIFDSHEDVPAQILTKKWLPAFIRKTVSVFYIGFEKLFLSKYNALISITPTLTKRLLMLNTQVYQVTNYPFLSDLIYPKEFFKEKTIVFAGGITPQWLHKEIILSIENMEDVVYNLAGKADEKYLAELKVLPGWKKVNYVGKLPFTQINEFIQESMIGIALCDYSPNVGGKTGSLGNTKLFEYMMAGIPVICTDFVLWKDIVEKNQCGICVNPHNIEEISNAINNIMENPEEAIRMGISGRKAVEKEYNWLLQEKELLRLYKLL